MKHNDLKIRMLAGETVYGIFINTASTIAVETAGLSGFDFVMIDGEHSPAGVLTTRELIAAAEVRSTVPLARVPNGHYDTILRMLDIGAHGVMVPQVNSPEKAKEVAFAALYTPKGGRGVATVRASDYGFCQPLSDYFQQANERNLVIVQCENVLALPHLDAIAATAGIDMIFVGPYDLSASMGTPGKVSYECIKDAVDSVLDVTRKHGKLAGIFTKDVQEAKMYAEMGFRLIVVSTDIACMTSGFRSLMNGLKKKE